MAVEIPEDVMEVAHKLAMMSYHWSPSHFKESKKAIARAILAERERCAKVAETAGYYVVENTDHTGRLTLNPEASSQAVWSGLYGHAIASAIRNPT